MDLFSILALFVGFGLTIFEGAYAAQAKNCTLTTHDASFQPDIILRVAQQQMNLAGYTESYPIVNGTYPGPSIELPAGQRTWIRVYNDMETDNLTMVLMRLSRVKNA